MRDSLYRLSIFSPRSDPSTVDVSVPAGCPVGMLLPALVDLVCGEVVAGPRRWHLSRLTGGVLDTAKTLQDNAVGDGDVLVLDVTGVPAPRRSPVDAAALVASSVASRTHIDPGRHPALREGAGLVTVAVVAAVLAWPGGAELRLWCAAALSAGAATVVLADRRCPLPITFSVGAVIFATVTGYLAAPQPSWQFGTLFAAGAGCAMSMLLRSALSHAAHLATVHMAISAAAVTVAAVAAIGVVVPLPLGATGAALAVSSVAALTFAARLAVGAAGLSPAREVVTPGAAAAAHRMVTGLVIGWAMCAGWAALAVVADGVRAGPLSVALAADVGLLLSLQARSHYDPTRRVALRTGAAMAWLAAFGALTYRWPLYAHWWCAGAALGCTALVYWRSRGRPANPVLRQSAQLLEYAALAAVVPLALWAAGVYGWVRGDGLL